MVLDAAAATATSAYRSRLPFAWLDIIVDVLWIRPYSQIRSTLRERTYTCHACRTAQNTLRLGIQPFFNYGCQRNATCECHFNYPHQIQVIQKAFIRRCVWHYCIFAGPTVGRHSQARDHCWHFSVGQMCAVSVTADMSHVRRSRSVRCTLSMLPRCARPGDEYENAFQSAAMPHICPVPNFRFDGLKAFASRHALLSLPDAFSHRRAHTGRDPK